jgi:hypothetical protein
MERSHGHPRGRSRQGDVGSTVAALSLNAGLAESSDKEEGKMRPLSDYDDRRESPRVPVDLPLEYRTPDNSRIHGGLVVNASETGLLMHSVQDLPLGSLLNIAILFLNGYELMEFEARAEIVWKDIHQKNGWKGYEYGLRFDPLEEKDHWKLQQLLERSFQREEMACCEMNAETLVAHQA